MSSRGFFLLRADTVRIVTSIRLQYSIFFTSVPEILRYPKFFPFQMTPERNPTERAVAAWLIAESKRIVLFAWNMDNAAVSVLYWSWQASFPVFIRFRSLLNPCAFPSISRTARFDGHTEKYRTVTATKKAEDARGVYRERDKSFRHPMTRMENASVQMPSEEKNLWSFASCRFCVSPC